MMQQEVDPVCLVINWTATFYMESAESVARY